MAGDNLRNRAKKGFVWNIIERLATNGIHFVITIVIARLLNPDDYGILAMPTVFLAIAQVLIDSGFANALIRKTDLNDKDLSTAFYFNILVGLASYLILFLASPLIADYFNTPILSKLLKVTALVVFINSLGIVQQAIMTKRMDFKTQSVISTVSTFLSGALGVWMAYNGFGVWALVSQQISAALIRIVLLWICGSWKPILAWSNESFKYLWAFGSKIVVIGILESIFNNLYSFIIGKKYNASDLGNYTRAQQFADLPMSNISGVVQRVTYPLLSEIQDNNTRLNTIYLRLIDMSSMFVIPLMVGLAAISSPLIIILLGEKWEGCILMCQILCVARIWTPFSVINVNLLQVKGKTGLLLKLDLVKKAVFAIIILLTIYHGIIYLVAGFAFYTFFGYMINTYYTKKIIGLGFKEQFLEVLPMLSISLTSFIFALLAITLFSNHYYQLLVGILVFVIVTFSLAFLFKRDTIKEVKNYLKKGKKQE